MSISLDTRRRRFFYGGSWQRAPGVVTVVPDYSIFPPEVGAHIAAMPSFDPRWLREVGLNSRIDLAGFIGLAGPYGFPANPEPDPAQFSAVPIARKRSHSPSGIGKTLGHLRTNGAEMCWLIVHS
jgi:hypothetical protein